MTTMKAITISKTGGIEVLQYVDLTIPEPTGAQILVRNKYSSINYIDIYFREGLYPSSLPLTLGKEGCGVVEKVGPDACFEVGDRVIYSTSSGSYAQFTLVDPPVIAKVPDDIDDRKAAASLIQGLTALTLVEETYAPRQGEWALVHAAAGGMGCWLVQVLHGLGVKVIATASTDEKLEFAKSLGADYGINYTSANVEAEVKKIISDGVHVVYDGVGKTTFESSLACLRRKGFLASFGNASGAVEPFSILKLAPKCIKLARPQLFGYLQTKEEVEYYSAKLFKILREGIKVEIHAEYALEDIATTHRDLESRATKGKLLIHH